jgi:ATP-dependent DNA ligase
MQKVVKALVELEHSSGSGTFHCLLRHDSPELRRVILYTLSPHKTFGVKKIGDYGGGEKFFDEASAISLMWDVLDDCASRKLSGAAASDELHRALTALSHYDLDTILLRILAKDLSCNVGTTTANKAFPGLIPEFACSLAKNFELKKAVWPLQGEVKYDGKRIIAIIDELGDSTLYSRSGKVEAKYQRIRNEIKAWHSARGFLGCDVMLDGELMWGMYGDRGENEADANYVVYDTMPLELWQSQGRTTSQAHRTSVVQGYFGPQDNRWMHLQPTLAKSLASYGEALSFYDEVLANGGEGIMLKDMKASYVFKRGKHWGKMKPILDADLPVVGCFEGEGKYVGMLGGIIVNHKGVQVRVGSGFDDYQRQFLWGNGYLNFMENLPGPNGEGTTAEIRYTEVTPDGSLRFPRFIKFRDDK